MRNIQEIILKNVLRPSFCYIYDILTFSYSFILFLKEMVRTRKGKTNRKIRRVRKIAKTMTRQIVKKVKRKVQKVKTMTKMKIVMRILLTSRKISYWENLRSLSMSEE